MAIYNGNELIDLSRDALAKLYSDFVFYRDEECNGLAKMGIVEFWRKNQKEYEKVALSQCDGCARGLPVFNRIHIEAPDLTPYMVCTAGLYA